MKSNLSRRELVGQLLLGAVVLPAAGTLAANAAPATAPAVAPVLVDPANPTAKALGFVRDASKVDAKVNPTYKAGQMCGGCAQFSGKPGDLQGGCSLFPGKQVPAKGWCRAFAAKPAAAVPAPAAKPAAAKPAAPGAAPAKK